MTLGSTELRLTNAKKGANYKMNFVVVNANVTPIIGSISAQQMDLLKIHHHNLLKVDIETPLTKTSMLVSYKDVFTGDDKMDGKLHLQGRRVSEASHTNIATRTSGTETNTGRRTHETRGERNHQRS